MEHISGVLAELEQRYEQAQEASQTERVDLLTEAHASQESAASAA